MATVNINQTDFSRGELDPRLIAKTTLDAFNRSALKLRNVLVDGRANVIKRFGTDFIIEITANSGEYRLAEFIFDDENIYLFVFTDLVLTIYKDDVQVASLVSPYPGSTLGPGGISFSQTYNYFQIMHPDIAYPPYFLSRGANDATWTQGVIPFKNLPTRDFLKNYDLVTFTLSPTTAGPGAILTSSVALFDATYIGGLFQGIGQADETTSIIGSARLTAFTNPTTMVVEISSDFDGSFGAGGVTGKFCVLEQPSWSATKGWPSTASFYEGRGIYSGAKSAPDQVACSVSNSYYNLDVGTGQPTDAIVESISGQKVGIVRHVIGDKTLQVFCSESEYTVPQIDGNSLKPPAAFRRQGDDGIGNMRPLTLDNQTFYVRKGGQEIMSYVFDNDKQSYQSVSASLSSAHLIRSPVDGDTMRSLPDDDNVYLFYVNGDGSLICHQTSKDKHISAWTLSTTTNGLFKRMAQVGDDVYFIVERTINGATKQYLEKLSFDHYSDSTVVVTSGIPITVITGLASLEGETVTTLADGYVEKDHVVTGGQISIEAASSVIEVGLKISSLIRTVPISYGSQKGQTTYLPKRIVKYTIDYFESLGLKVNGVPIPDLEFEVSVFDALPELQTGIYTNSIPSDWAPRQSLDITHDAPLPFSIIGIGFEVSS